MKKTWIIFVLIIMMLLGLTACGDKGEDVTGKYLCTGESYFGGELQAPAAESWLELKKGGKGTYHSGFDFKLKWQLEGESFSATVTFLGMENAMEGTLKNGVIDVKYGDMNIRFVKEGMQDPGNAAPNGTTGTDGTAGTAGANDDVTLAGSIDEAFQGVNTFVGVPDEVLTGKWYGWIRESQCWGGHEEDFQDMSGQIGYNTDTGRKFMDFYKDGNTAYPEFSMWLKESEGDVTILPDIGEQDAWLLDTYLTKDEEGLFETRISSDGSLYFSYECVDDSGESGCLVEIFLRKEGAEWDEMNDTLPPRYAEHHTRPVG